MIKLMGYNVFEGELSAIDLKNKKVINTINPHSYITAKGDQYFKQALQNSDLLVPDGSGIVLAAKQIGKHSIKKIAGSDLHNFLLKETNYIGGKVFYMGASQKTLNKIEKKIKKEFLNIKVESYSPPFKAEFSKQDNDKIVDRINTFKPDVLFVGMTAPKQEKWLHANKEKLDFITACSIGAVFDFYAGTIKRPSKFWLELHLEWLLRFIKEPRRLWRRNFISTPLFLLDMILYKFGFIK